MTPIDYYNDQIHQGRIAQDQEQLVALQCLQNVYFNLLKEHQHRSKSYLFWRMPKKVQGLYLWGGVGIGKTFMMDCFYHCIPFDNKVRIHFHKFMKNIHQELKRHQGKKNPLQLIAKQLAKKSMVLCFDEFFVSDITDAMILGNLFQELSAQGICFIITSNVKPDDLYKNGLQRELFLPAIELLKNVTKVFHVPTIQDFRLKQLSSTGAFYTPNDEIANENLEKCFTLLSNNKSYQTDSVEVCGRSIKTIKQSDNVIWFDFDSLCSIPRSHHDYLTIAEKFDTVIISNIPKILPSAKNTISLFIRMIDIFYDSRIRLICSSEECIDNIYSEGHMKFEYARTRSRLVEMQSARYLISIHVDNKLIKSSKLAY